MEKVTDMFRHTFPYTTIYPSLGNLDITSSNMLSNRFPKSGSPYHRARRPHGQGSNRNGHRRRGKKGNFVYKKINTKHISIYLKRLLWNYSMRNFKSSTEDTRKYYNLLSIQISSINNVQTSRLLSFLIYLTLPFAILSSFESIYTGMIEWNNPWPFYQVIKYFKLLYSKYCSFLMYMARLHANFSFCVWKYIGCSLILQLLVVAIGRTFLVVKFLW